MARLKLMKRGSHKKTKRAAEVSAGIIILLGLGAGALGVLIYNRSKPVATPLPPLPPPVAPPPVVSPPAPPPVVVPIPLQTPSTLDQGLR